ncbi:hypothetical protein [Bhargavaea beijingensis]|uniref:Uncharacterized protein n=1 Tax=Bhargavaea beijingensis TaxID=426756 RepID=A0ABX9ZC74_9BACL|nr:hypothetical protein [Bhargavaea beijingensis]RSK30979.1 hypothetical protein EJA12_09690 [Bhargavaea beijingensis]
MTKWNYSHFTVLQQPHGPATDCFEIVQGGEVRMIITPMDHDAQLDIVQILNSGSHPAHWQTGERITVEFLLPLYIGKEDGFYITRQPIGQGGAQYTIRNQKGRLLKQKYQTIAEVYEEIQKRLAPEGSRKP